VPAATATIGSAVVARLPFLPAEAGAFHVARTSMLMDTGKAKSLLGWTPNYTAAQTLQALAAAVSS
jgi:nucleoside-diphosphate-sugar epimerase